MTTLKMEDDLVDYEEFKNRISTQKKLFSPNRFGAQNYMSPYSIKLNNEQGLEEEDPDSSNFQAFHSPERLRSNPLRSPTEEERDRQPGDYINQLLNNIIQDDDDN